MWWVAMYPNPVKNQLYVTTENLQSIEVYNIVGQQVLVTQKDVVDMSALTEGIYFVRVISDGKMITKRIVKQ